MEILTKIIYTLLGTALFLSSLALVLYSSDVIQRYQDEIKEEISVNNVMINSDYDGGSDVIISYEELCSRLMGRIEYDFVINGTRVPSFLYNPNTFSFDSLQETSYRVTYEYYNNGAIKSIVFSSI